MIRYERNLKLNLNLIQFLLQLGSKTSIYIFVNEITKMWFVSNLNQDVCSRHNLNAAGQPKFNQNLILQRA